MAKLRCESFAERSTCPGLHLFFSDAFSFLLASANRPQTLQQRRADACSVRADALASAGGIASIRNALIDDCSLAAKLKTIGPIWLGLTDRVQQHPSLCDALRRQADDFAICLCTTSLFAAAVGCNGCDDGTGFHCATTACDFCHRFVAIFRYGCLACDDCFFHTDATFLSAVAILGSCLAGDCRRSTCITPSFPRISICGDGAANGRGAFKLMRRACNDP